MTVNKSHRIKVITPVYKTLIVADKGNEFFAQNRCFSTAREIALLFSYLQNETKEHFITCHLDNKNKLICVETVSTGSLTASIVHPREVFKSALLSSAAAMILVHNHPSGDPEPSREDLNITQRLKQGAELLGIRLLDHIIIGLNGRYISLADRGLL